MNEVEFKRRTKQLALRVISLIQALEAIPHNLTAQVISKQLIRSATSVGANYRSACRAKSTADIIAKLSLVEEEADESLYWMELIVESALIPQEKLTNLMSETTEILAMTVASIKTLRIKSQHPKSKI
ncbi:MAG: four helix bundle protein [Nostocales cyanobacterium 94392]|nr:four helix bundle protein [Nostocales cyanobacterium 94392]